VSFRYLYPDHSARGCPPTSIVCGVQTGVSLALSNTPMIETASSKSSPLPITLQRASLLHALHGCQRFISRSVHDNIAAPNVTHDILSNEPQWFDCNLEGQCWQAADLRLNTHGVQ
jgi:hypothetical protein